MQVCISLQTDNQASTPPHSFYRPDDDDDDDFIGMAANRLD